MMMYAVSYFLNSIYLFKKDVGEYNKLYLQNQIKRRLFYHYNNCASLQTDTDCTQTYLWSKAVKYYGNN